MGLPREGTPHPHPWLLPASFLQEDGYPGGLGGARKGRRGVTWCGAPLGVLRDGGDGCGMVWRKEQARLAPGVRELWLPLLLMLQRLRAGIHRIRDGEVVSWAFHFYHAPSFPTREELGLDYASPISPLPPAHACTLLFLLFSLFGASFLSPVFSSAEANSHKNPTCRPVWVSPPRLVPPCS